MNHAHIGNLVFERDDGESVPDFLAHVRAAAAELGGGVLAWGAPESLEWVEGSQTNDIEGGLERDGSENFATVGGVLIEREDGEPVEAFRARAREAAVAAGSEHIVFGGLRPMNITDEQPKENEQ
jgi:hypothetical protein